MIENYLYSVLVLSLFVISANVISLIIHKFVKGLVKRSKSKLDDILLCSFERPLFIFLILVGLYFAWNYLSFDGRINEIFNRALSTLVIIDGFYFLITFVDAFIVHYIKPLTDKTKTKLDETLLPVVRRIVKITLFIIGFIFVLERFGYNVSSLVAGLGIGGLAFALAAKDILGNLFGGVSIFTDKPFKVGQTIKVMGHTGKVKEIGLRSTKILTLDGTNIMVPNSKINDDVVENISMEKDRKVKLNLSLSYKTSNSKIKKAKELIKKIIEKNENAKDKSSVYLTSFNESSLNLLVIYRIENVKKLLQAKDEINLSIKEAFEKNKIEFAYPTQTLFLKK
jgi:MscS family membrane protein